MADEYRLKDLFLSRPNEWISLKEIMDLRIGQYNRAISDLRKRGMDIENKTDWEGRVCHSRFMYHEPSRFQKEKPVEITVEASGQRSFLK